MLPESEDGVAETQRRGERCQVITAAEVFQERGEAPRSLATAQKSSRREEKRHGVLQPLRRPGVGSERDGKK